MISNGRLGARRKGDPREDGFTLLEIAIAVAILGVALVTLVGLQTRLIDSYVQEKNREQAALYAQYLMSITQVQVEAPEVGTEEKDLESILREAGYFDNDRRRDFELMLDGWSYLRSVSSISAPTVEGLPPLEDILRRIDLEIRWGEAEDESYRLVYFMQPKAATTTSAYPQPPNYGTASQR